MYRFDVEIEAREDVLYRISEVVYYLPPAWPTSPYRVGNRASRFELSEVTFADLVVRAEVYFPGRGPVVALACAVTLPTGGTLV